MSDATSGHPLDRLSPYLDDELPVEDRAAIDRHLALCADCREHLDALSRLSSAIAAEPVPPLPGDLEERVLRRIDAAAVVPLRRRRLVVPASIAATIAAVGLVAVVAWKGGGHDLVPSPAREVDRVPAILERDKMTAEQKASAPMPAPPPAEAASPIPAGAAAGAAAKSRRDDATVEKAAANVAAPAPEAEAEPSGVVGGVAGGGEEDAEGGFAKAKDERPTDAKGRASGVTPVASVAPAARSQVNAPLVPCVGPVDDSGVEGVWEVTDRTAAARDLEALAVTHGGRLENRGAEAPHGIALVVPRARYVEFVTAARAMGIAGLDSARVAAGEGCVRQPIVLRDAPPG